MNGKDFDKWCEENATSLERKHCNGLDYVFATMTDHWIAIFQYNHMCGDNTYAPLIQSADIEHAVDYIAMREPVVVPMQRL